MDSALRTRLNDSMKAAMKSQDKIALSTVRLILAAIKDRDIAARGKGNTEGLSDDEIKQYVSYFKWADQNLQPKGSAQPQPAAPR